LRQGSVSLQEGRVVLRKAGTDEPTVGVIDVAALTLGAGGICVGVSRDVTNRAPSVDGDAILEMLSEVQEVEVNPLFVYPDGVVAVDARVFVGE
jgi:hypothetical protein